MTTTEVGSRIKLKNILLATDFSLCSQAALRVVVAIARPYGATVYAAHVWPSEADILLMSTMEGWSGYEAEDRAVKEYIGQMEQELRGLPHYILTPRGYVPTALCQIIEQRGIDLMVLGTHGRTGTSKLLLGSVAEAVFRQAPCPVLTVGPGVSSQISVVEPDFRRILFATDFSKESVAALPFAVSLAEENAAQLVLVHVVQQPCPGVIRPCASITTLHAQLREMVPAESALWCNIETRVVFAAQFVSPAERILDVAHENSADLIVIGPRKVRSGIVAVPRLANTTAEVLSKAACPVLTVCS